MVAETNPEVKKAVVRLEVLSGDERARYIADMEEKAWRDQKSFERQAREQGLEEGLEIGKLTIARNLLAKGSTLEFTSEITGLSIEQIQKL